MARLETSGGGEPACSDDAIDRELRHADLSPDIVIAGGSIQLRAERFGSGKGRIYDIRVTATDVAGNSATATATCTVPVRR